MDKLYQVICLLLLLLAESTASIQLVGHGYENVVIAVGQDVDVDPELLTTFESILTNASAFLFSSTRNKLYYREFIIVLPEHWPRKDHYEDASDLELDEADVLLDVPNEGLGNTPYVLSYRICGGEGLYMHLTPNYIMDESIRSRYGKPGLVFVHEWGHLRFGIFDEYPYTTDQMFYRKDDMWYPTRCSLEVEGELINIYTYDECRMDGDEPEYGCRFYPYLENNPAVSTIMFGNYLQNISEFCDDSSTAPDHLKHNPLPNNNQNIYCFYQSNWEVMRRTPDFMSVVYEPALPDDTDTQPRFRYVQAHPRSRVLVLDTSGSMSGPPLDVLRMAIGNFIMSTMEDGGFLGIVHFASTASTLSPLRQINSDFDREALVNALPSSATDATSIGAGLLLGLQELNKTGSNSGGSIILITDGRENLYPYIDDVAPAILEAGVVVHSVSYGQYADPKIASLSEDTGGRAFFFNGNGDSTALLDSLANAVSKGQNLMPKENVSVPILTEANTVTPDKPLTGSFYIDSTIGKDTTLTFSYTQSIHVVIESPNGPYNPTNAKTFSNPHSPAIVLRIVLENNPPPGLWSYTVTTDASEVSVLVDIHSRPRTKKQDFIQVNGWLSQQKTMEFSTKASIGVYASVMRGQTPVIDASVIATVETPCTKTFDLVLLDNGKDADVIKDNGIYSGWILPTDLCADGRYNVKINVIGHKEYTKVFTAGTGSANAAAMLPTLAVIERNTETRPLEDFQRVTTAGEFSLSNYTRVEKDDIPPGRIMDFRAKKYNSQNGTATLVWTAVGGDMDRGQAAQYIIYKSIDVEDITKNLSSASRVPEHHVTQGNLSSPSSSGKLETFVVFLEELENNDTRTVYMSISAVDEAGNVGQASNLVTVSDARQLAPVSSRVKRSKPKTTLMIGVIVGSVAFVVIATIVIGVVVFRSKKSGEKETLLKK